MTSSKLTHTDERQKLFGLLKASHSNALQVTITLSRDSVNRRVVGIVTGLDPRLYLIKVETRTDWQLIDFLDVIGVELDIEPGRAL